MLRCPGNYCNVYLEEDVIAKPLCDKILEKSLLLDRYEDGKANENDPLGLKSRIFLSLDYLMQKLPNKHISNFYNMRKVCANCLLSYSIIDNQRFKSAESLKKIRISADFNNSPNCTSRKLSFISKNTLKTAPKHQSIMAKSFCKEYNSLQSVLLPIKQARLSKVIRNRININEDCDSEEDDKMPINKEVKTSFQLGRREICELAKSITNKRLLDRRISRRMNLSKTLPHIYSRK